MYFREHPADLDKLNVPDDEYCGFIWMRRAMGFMDNFYANRALYPHIEDFIPQLAEYFHFMANEIEVIMQESELMKPCVVRVYPSLNNIIDPNVKELIVEFSHPMSPKKGFSIIQEEGLKSAMHEKDGQWLSEKPSWCEDKRTLIIPVRLEQNSSYGIALFYWVFESTEKYHLTKTYELRFKTSK